MVIITLSMTHLALVQFPARPRRYISASHRKPLLTNSEPYLYISLQRVVCSMLGYHVYIHNGIHLYPVCKYMHQTSSVYSSIMLLFCFNFCL